MRFALSTFGVPSPSRAAAIAGVAALGAIATCLSGGAAAAASQPRPVQLRGGEFTLIEPAKTPAGACAPVVIVSRGLGAGQTPMRYLAVALAQHGYRVIVMRHPEAPRSVFQGRLLRSGRLHPKAGEGADPVSLRRRADDLSEAVELARKSCKPPFMALIGHAAGATTTLIEAGAKPRFAVPGKDRFDAYVALSPVGPGRAFAAGAWTGVAKPALVVTGTRDRMSRGGWRPRIAAFQSMPAGGKRLAIIQGATHFALGGLGSPAVKQKIVKLTLGFLDQARAGALKPETIPGVEIKDK